MQTRTQRNEILNSDPIRSDPIGFDDIQANLVKVVFDGQRRKNRVVHERGSQVRQHARTVLLFVFEQESGDQIVQHCITQKFQPLNNVCVCVCLH